MKVRQTDLLGVLIIEPDCFGDERGFFLETYREQRYLEEAGIDARFVQDNHSRSRRGVLRGLHAQRRHPQGKLVRVVRGEVFDVAADIDPNSPTYGHWVGAMLSDTNHLQLWIPPGYVHGFQVISSEADFEYKCTDYYHAGDEIGVRWDDPVLGIRWPVGNPKLSDKDLSWPTLDELRAQA